MQLKIDQINDFLNTVLPTLSNATTINLWDFTEKYPFILQIIEDLNYKNRSVTAMGVTNCVRDSKGVLQDRKVPQEEKLLSKYEQMISERQYQDSQNDKTTSNKKIMPITTLKTKYVTFSQLKQLIEQLYIDTKGLIEHEQIQHFIKSLKADYQATSKTYVDYCNEYEKYEKLKETVIELSKVHESIKKQIAVLDIQKDQSKKAYDLLNDNVQNSIVGMIEQIDTEALRDLQSRIENVAGRYHYLKQVNEKITPKTLICSLCSCNDVNAVLECGHQGCYVCLTKTDLLCTQCGAQNSKIITLK
jgi:hypothetical protein